MSWGRATVEQYARGKTVYTVSGARRGQVVRLCGHGGRPRLTVQWPGLGGITHVYDLDQLLVRGDGHLQLRA